MVLLILLGTALRLVPLVGEPLHQDEALYGFWGRLISSGRDAWLARVPVDKPPLALYLIAGSQITFGVSEFAVRLPALAASLLAIPLTYVFGRRLYGDRTVGLVAAAVVALTPYAVLFGAAAFTDSILIVWWLAACYAALSGRWGWSGLMVGLALAAKQQAVVLAPLVIGLGLVRGGGVGRGWLVASARFVLGLGLVVAAVFVWDATRIASGAKAGFWGQGVESYGGLRLIWSAELEPRLQGWARLAGYLLGWPWLGVLFFGGTGALLWHNLIRQPRTRSALADLILITFAVFYLLLHLLLAFPVWDRYLLPLMPVMALLLGRMVSVSWSAVSDRRQVATFYASRFTSYALRLTFPVLIVVLLTAGGLIAASGRVPVGGDHGAYDGLTEVVDFLRDLPGGTVLYDRWLSWHYDFYLFDAYLYRAGFPSPGWLAADVAAFYDGQPRYLVVPDWESSARLERALDEVGLRMSPVLETHRRGGATSFVVYEIGR